MRLLVAFRAFFAALASGETSRRIEGALDAGGGATRLEHRSDAKAQTKSEVAPDASAKTSSAPKTTVAPKPPASQRSDALTLLSVLQREARLLDLVHESLESYNDAQIGSAARDVLRDTRKVLDRMFAIHPASEQSEGSRLEVPEGASALRYRIVGNQSAGAATQGTIVHAGWTATQCQVPQWTGKSDESLILAPIEVEVTR